MSWWAELFRQRRYQDLAVSIEEHIAEKTDELIEAGMPRAEAERAARRAFGNRTVVTERSREAWQWTKLESLLTDVRLVFRRLRKAPGFAVTVLLTLAIGIGANTAVFTVVNSVLLKPLPYPEPNRLVELQLDAPGAGGLANFSEGLRLSPSMYFTFKDNNRTLEQMGVWTANLANVTGLAQPEQVHTILLSDGLLETLAVAPAAGRWLNQADQDPHGGKTVMLSYGYWQRRFGGDRSAIGRNITLDSIVCQIVGVMPQGFRVENKDFDLLVPLAFDRGTLKLAPFGYKGIGRLKPGVSIAAANADLSRLIPVWMHSWTNGPKTDPLYYKTWRIRPDLKPLKQAVVGDVSRVLWVVMATIGLVMLIACANVANLLMVRADARQQELAVRSALGAGRARIARELLLESLVLGLLGGALGIGVAVAGLQLLKTIGPANLPRLAEVRLDGWSLTFTLVLSVFCGVLFGAFPAFKHASARTWTGMGGLGRTSSMSRERNRSRNVLVVGQVAMALVLLVSAVLMIRTFAHLRSVQPGFTDAAQVQTLRVSIPDSLVSDPQMVTRMENEIANRLAALPGVRGAAFAVGVPMDGVEPNWDQILIEGKKYDHSEPPMRFFNYVSPGYFSTVGTRLVAGHDFDWTNVYGLQHKVIVSENFARESWGSDSAAIGKRVRQFESLPWEEVIGVAQDVRQLGVDAQPPAIIYWPSMQNSPYVANTIYASRSVAFVLRTQRAGTQELLKEMQQAIWSVNGNLPIASVVTMMDLYDHSLARTSFALAMLGIAGAMSLLLGIIGIYGVISYAVSQRTREIGIRLALGAQRGELRWMFVRSALALTGIGVSIGLVAAAGLTQAMKSLLYGVSPTDPFTYASIAVLLAGCAAVASYLPARRAAAVNPVEALRAE